MARVDEWRSFLVHPPDESTPPPESSEDTLTPLARARQSMRRRSWACPVPREDLEGFPPTGELTTGSKETTHLPYGSYGSQGVPGWQGTFGAQAAETVARDGEEERGEEREEREEGEEEKIGVRAGVWGGYGGREEEREEVMIGRVPYSEGGGGRLGGRGRRVSCDTYDCDELEAARMRVKQAAWEVVRAQQEVDIGKMQPTGRRTTEGKKKSILKKWLTSPLTWRPMAASRG